MEPDVQEVAVFEVQVGDQWVEWNRLERKSGQQWDTNLLAGYRPRCRSRFLRLDGSSLTIEG